MKKIINYSSLIVFSAFLFSLASCGKDSNPELLSSLFFDDGSNVNFDEYAASRGLVAYYAFEGTTYDSTGNGLDADIHGNVYLQEGHKVGTKCVYFDGNANNYLYVSPGSALIKDNWTINLWFKCTDAEFKDGSLVSMGSGRKGSFDILQNMLYIITNSSPYSTYINNGASDWFPSFNQWHMLTTTMGGETITQYLDGVMMWSHNLSSSYANNTNSKFYFAISSWEGSLKYPFKGCIDDVRIYDWAISESVVKYLYTH